MALLASIIMGESPESPSLLVMGMNGDSLGKREGEQSIMILQVEKVLTPARRLLHLSGLIVAVALLLWIGEGFPPLPWRTLYQVLPQLSERLHAFGFAAGAAFVGIAILSLIFFVLWSAVGIGFLWFVSSIVKDCTRKWSPLTWQSFFTASMQAVVAQGLQGEQSVEPSPKDNTTSWAHGKNVTRSKRHHASSEKEERETALLAAQEQQRPSLRTPPLHHYSQDDTNKKNEIAWQKSMPTSVAEFLTSPQSAIQKRPQEVMSMSVSAASDVGLVRKDRPNEDAVLTMQTVFETRNGPQPVALLMVADGMGGHARGREASCLAIEVFSNTMRGVFLSYVEDEAFLIHLLHEAVQAANTSLYQQNQGCGIDAMMGTTLTAALLIGRNVCIVNVGDSRAYVFRPGQGMTQITRDHSRVARMVEQGVLSPEEVYTHPQRNQIYRCLGHEEDIQIDFFQQTLRPGDGLLLCSDGLWEMVRDPEMATIMQHSLVQPPFVTSTQLIQAAFQAGGADNVSVIVAVTS